MTAFEHWLPITQLFELRSFFNNDIILNGKQEVRNSKGSCLMDSVSVDRIIQESRGMEI